MTESRRFGWAGHVVRLEEDMSAFKILTGNRPLGRPRLGWETNIRMDFKEIGIIIRNWFDSGQDRDNWRPIVNATLNLWVPKAWLCKPQA